MVSARPGVHSQMKWHDVGIVKGPSQHSSGTSATDRYTYRGSARLPVAITSLVGRAQPLPGRFRALRAFSPSTAMKRLSNVDLTAIIYDTSDSVIKIM